MALPSQVDTATIKYRDKAREKQRQQSLLRKATAETEQEVGTKEEEEKQVAANNKRKPEQQQQHLSGERLTAAKRRKLQQREEVQDLTDEVRGHEQGRTRSAVHAEHTVFVRRIAFLHLVYYFAVCAAQEAEAGQDHSARIQRGNGLVVRRRRGEWQGPGEDVGRHSGGNIRPSW